MYKISFVSDGNKEIWEIKDYDNMVEILNDLYLLDCVNNIELFINDRRVSFYEYIG